MKIIKILGETWHKSEVKFENIHDNANSNSFMIVTQSKIEKAITKILKEVFEEKFEKQEVSITKIISGHFMSTKKEI